MTTVAAGDAGGDGEPRLTPEQQESIARAFADPAVQESVLRLQLITEQLTGDVSARLLTGFAPVIEQVQHRGRVLAEALAPSIGAHLDFVRAVMPIAERVGQFQQQIAAQLQGPVIESSRFQQRLAELFISADLTAALQRVSDLSTLPVEIPSGAGLARISDVLDANEIDEETVELAERAVSGNPDLSAAIDDAAAVFARDTPLLTRRRARQIIVVWVWVMWAAAMWAVAVYGDPKLVPLPGVMAVSASKSAAKAGDLFDKRYPPDGDDE